MKTRHLVFAITTFAAPALVWPSLSTFDNYRSGYGWARPAGAGGAWVAAPLSLEALYENPSGLPAETTQLLVGGAHQGSLGWQGGLQLSTPVDPGLRLGLGISQDLISWPLAGSETSYSLGMGLDLDTASTFGLRLDYQRLEQGAFTVSGFNMDFGLRRAQKLPWRNHELIIGGVIQNALTSWPDRNWAKTQSSTWRTGLSWHWRGLGSIGAEWQAPREVDGLAPEPVVSKLGTEWRWGSITSRAGMSNQARQRWSAGAGWAQGLSGFGVQYALLGSDKGELQHRFELAWVFKATRMLEAPVEARDIAVDPNTGNIKRARLSLETPDRRDVKSWRLDIRDKQGNLVRTLEGQGDPPRELIWDGKDALGLAVQFDEGLVYRLSLRGPEDALLASARVLHSDLELTPSWELSSLNVLPTELLGDVAFETLAERRFELNAPGFASGSLWTLTLIEPGLSSLPIMDDGTVLAANRYETLDSRRLELATRDPEGGRVWWLVLVEPSMSSLPIDESLFKNWALTSTNQDTGVDQGHFELLAAVDSRGRTWSLELSDPKLVLLSTQSELVVAQVAATEGNLAQNPTQVTLRARFSPIRVARALQPEPTKRLSRKRRPLSASTHTWKGSGDTVFDVFIANGDALDPAKKAALVEALRRFQGGTGRRLRLTGLVGKKEQGGAKLSRARALRFSTWLSDTAGYQGDYVIQVMTDSSARQGVKIESIR